MHAIPCPFDGSTLTAIDYEGVCIRTCEKCGGELLTGEEMTHIVSVREAAFDAGMKRMLASEVPTWGIPSREQSRTISCPCCGQPMSVLNYSGDTGVIIDKCHGCGAIWLDNEELEKIQILLERWQDEAPEQLEGIAGKLERAREQAEETGANAFNASRFSFVNAVMNRLLDAA